jgi:uncharacterized protein
MTMQTIDVRDLVGRPGASKEQSLHGTLDGLGTELAAVPEDAPIVGELLLESVVEGILVSGRLAGTLKLGCARCLTEFERPFTVEVREMFVERPDEDADDYPLDPEGALDPGQMVRDVVGVELPFSPLCRPDCLGLCPICGGNRNLGECPGHDEVDPRFAVLSKLLPDLPSEHEADLPGDVPGELPGDFPTDLPGGRTGNDRRKE